MEPSAREKSLVELAFQFVSCINRRDLLGLASMMSEDHTFVDLANDVHRGREMMVAGWASYMTMFPEYVIHLHDYAVQGEMVFLMGTTSGSHTGQSLEEEFRDPVIWAAAFRDGQVSEWRIYPDRQEVRQSLGLPTSRRGQPLAEERATSLHQWVDEFPGPIEVCDPEGVLLAINERAAAKEGHPERLGTNILGCHPEPARSKLKEMLASGRAHAFIKEKDGQKTLYYEVPWTVNGEYRGFVDIGLPLPDEIPHFVREGQ